MLFLSLAGNSCFGQVSTKDSLLIELRKAPQMECPYVNGNSEIFETACLLTVLCPIDTLIRLTADPCPIVRCYMFDGLIKKNADVQIIEEIYDQHKNDSTKFKYQCVDVGLEFEINQYMYNHLLNYKKYREDLLNGTVQPQKALDCTQEPSYTLDIPGVEKGVISKEDLLKVDSLVCSEKEYKVVSFILTFPKKSKLLSINSQGNLVSPLMKRKIKKLRSGDKLYIEEIHVNLTDGKTRSFAAINLKLK
jgi:hypothetical protein